MARMNPVERRDNIVDAALSVMLRKGMAATTVRDVADEMGTSSGLIHHYFTSMDDLLAAAFDRAASQDLNVTRDAMTQGVDPVKRLAIFFATYARAEQDWAFQLWLDAWAEASRRPARAGHVTTAQRGLAAAAGGSHPGRDQRQVDVVPRSRGGCVADLVLA